MRPRKRKPPRISSANGQLLSHAVSFPIDAVMAMSKPPKGVEGISDRTFGEQRTVEWGVFRVIRREMPNTRG